MCDPLTLLGGAIGLIGNKKPKPPPTPAKALENAKEETGAEVVLGSEKSTSVDSTSTTKQKTTAGTALRTNKNVGLSIL